ncbi:MAG: PilW family protein [Pedobacter sp.]|nr:PilW family protein [Pedobacter sp.]
MSTSRFRQSGLSLIELMISVILGLLLVAGATQIFLANTQAFRLQDNISRTQESGRLGLEILLADLRRAGMDYSNVDAVVGANGSATVATNTGLLTNSDEVTIKYTVPDEIGAMSDCEGNTVAPGSIVTNRYFVKMDTNPAIPALFCSGSGGAGTALVRGVESFQVQYGVADAASVGNGFISAEKYVTAGAATLVNVASIRVGLLMRSEASVQGLVAPKDSIVVLDTTVTDTALAAVKVNGSFPIHRYFSGMAVMRNAVKGTL